MNEQTPELNYQEFVRARKVFRGQTETIPATSEEDNENFMLYSAGPDALFAVFENLQPSGWFYLYDARERRVLRGTLVRGEENVAMEEEIVDIGWAADDSACGLALWGEFRAFLGVSNNVEISKPVMDTDEHGISSTDWPAGFDHYLEPKTD